MAHDIKQKLHMLCVLQGACGYASWCRAGLACNQFVPGIVRRAQPFLAAASLTDTCACVGASPASNIATARSPVGATALVPVRQRPLPWYVLGVITAHASTRAHAFLR